MASGTWQPVSRCTPGEQRSRPRARRVQPEPARRRGGGGGRAAVSSEHGGAGGGTRRATERSGVRGVPTEGHVRLGWDHRSETAAAVHTSMSSPSSSAIPSISPAGGVGRARWAVECGARGTGALACTAGVGGPSNPATIIAAAAARSDQHHSRPPPERPLASSRGPVVEPRPEAFEPPRSLSGIGAEGAGRSVARPPIRGAEAPRRSDGPRGAPAGPSQRDRPRRCVRSREAADGGGSNSLRAPRRLRSLSSVVEPSSHCIESAPSDPCPEQAPCQPRRMAPRSASHPDATPRLPPPAPLPGGGAPARGRPRTPAHPATAGGPELRRPASGAGCAGPSAIAAAAAPHGALPCLCRPPGASGPPVWHAAPTPSPQDLGGSRWAGAADASLGSARVRGHTP